MLLQIPPYTLVQAVLCIPSCRLGWWVSHTSQVVPRMQEMQRYEGFCEVDMFPGNRSVKRQVHSRIRKRYGERFVWRSTCCCASGHTAAQREWRPADELFQAQLPPSSGSESLQRLSAGPGTRNPFFIRQKAQPCLGPSKLKELAVRASQPQPKTIMRSAHMAL